jgi:hypothetical protein
MERVRNLVLIGLVAGGLLAGAGGCTVDRTTRLAPGAGLTRAGDAIAVDPAAVPLVSGGCTSGQEVARTGGGWACVAPSGATGPTGATGATGATGPAGSQAALAELQAAVAALQTDVAALEAAQCPRGLGFTHDDSEAPYVVCARTVGAGTDATRDEMVKVGSFWVDRFKSIVCPGSGVIGAAPGTGDDTRASACSTSGEPARVGLTWLQAAAMCANAGKRLCTGAEWQAAAAGTPDPGAFPGVQAGDPWCNEASSTTSCNTCARTAGVNGQATLCVSRAGGYDFIGNYFEWIADWYQAGRPWPGGTFVDGSWATPWPAGFGDGFDETANVGGRAKNGTSMTDGLPAVGIRSSCWYCGAGAGAFEMSMSDAASSFNTFIAARCCAGQ